MRSSFLQKYKPKITKISALPYKFFLGDFLVSVGSFFGYDLCLFGMAEILILGLHFGRNDDLINFFWIQMTFSRVTKSFIFRSFSTFGTFGTFGTFI